MEWSLKFLRMKIGDTKNSSIKYNVQLSPVQMSHHRRACDYITPPQDLPIYDSRFKRIGRFTSYANTHGPWWNGRTARLHTFANEICIAWTWPWCCKLWLITCDNSEPRYTILFVRPTNSKRQYRSILIGWSVVISGERNRSRVPSRWSLSPSLERTLRLAPPVTPH